MDGKHGLKELALQYMENGKEAIASNQLEEAVRMLTDAVHLFKRCEEDRLFAKCLNLLGMTYENTGNDIMAIDSYLEGLEVSKSREFNFITAMFYNNIGTRYQKLNEHRKAAEFFIKSKTALEKETCKEAEYYKQKLRTNINFALSYIKLSKTELAQQNLEKAIEIINEHQLTEYDHIIMILTCNLLWKTGEFDHARKNIPALLKLIKYAEKLADYVQNVQEASLLLKEMGEYEVWKSLLTEAEKEAEARSNYYFRLICTELWLDYYQTIKDIASYETLCVEYVALYQKMKTENDSQRVLALDVKVALKEMEVQRKIAEEKSRQDALTGIQNRYSLEQSSLKFVQKAVQSDKPVLVGIIDIDYFKKVNDTYGHIQGDKCLRESARVIQNCVSGYGDVYRYGGDEFVILIEDGETEVAYRIANRIRQRINEKKLYKECPDVEHAFTVSQGYACFKPKMGEHLADILFHADRALYKAKNSGRNKYEVIVEKDGFNEKTGI